MPAVVVTPCRVTRIEVADQQHWKTTVGMLRCDRCDGVRDLFHAIIAVGIVLGRHINNTKEKGRVACTRWPDASPKD